MTAVTFILIILFGGSLTVASEDNEEDNKYVIEYETANEMYKMMLMSFNLKSYNKVAEDSAIVERNDNIYERWSKQKAFEVADDNFCKNYKLMDKWLKKELLKIDGFYVHEEINVEAFQKIYLTAQLQDAYHQYKAGQRNDESTTHIAQLYSMVWMWLSTKDSNIVSENADEDKQLTNIFDQWLTRRPHNYWVIDDDFWKNYELAEDWLNKHLGGIVIEMDVFNKILLMAKFLKQYNKEEISKEGLKVEFFLLVMMSLKFKEFHYDRLRKETNADHSEKWLKQEFSKLYTENMRVTDGQMHIADFKKTQEYANLLLHYDEYIDGEKDIENIVDLKGILKLCFKQENEGTYEQWEEENKSTYGEMDVEQEHENDLTNSFEKQSNEDSYNTNINRNFKGKYQGEL